MGGCGGFWIGGLGQLKHSKDVELDSRKFDPSLVEFLLHVFEQVVVVVHVVDLHCFLEQSHLPPHFPGGSFGSSGSMGLPSGHGFL